MRPNGKTPQQCREDSTDQARPNQWSMPATGYAGLLVALLANAPETPAQTLEDAQAAYQSGELAYAFEIFEELGLDGDPLALTLAAGMLQAGEGTRVDHPEALRFYRAAAARGEAKALVALGRIFRDGVGVARDPEAAVGWFENAATLDDAEGQFYLAEMLRDGIGAWPRTRSVRSNSSGSPQAWATAPPRSS